MKVFPGSSSSADVISETSLIWTSSRNTVNPSVRFPVCQLSPAMEIHGLRACRARDTHECQLWEGGTALSDGVPEVSTNTARKDRGSDGEKPCVGSSPEHGSGAG